MEDIDVYDIARRLRSVDMFPFFDIANSIRAAMLVRASLGAKFPEFSMHPITCWITTVLSQSAGGIISNLLLGKPVMAIFSDPYKLAIATIIWFLVFYSRFYDLAKFCPVAVLCSAMAEVHRAKRIFGGVSTAAEVYPTSYNTMILIGMIRGNGKEALKIISTIINRLKSPHSTDKIQMGVWTKLSLLAASLFALNRLHTVNEKAFVEVFPKILAPHIMLDLAFMAVVLMFEIFMLLSFMNFNFDPFAPLSNIVLMSLCVSVLFYCVPAAERDDLVTETCYPSVTMLLFFRVLTKPDAKISFYYNLYVNTVSTGLYSVVGTLDLYYGLKKPPGNKYLHYARLYVMLLVALLIIGDLMYIEFIEKDVRIFREAGSIGDATRAKIEIALKKYKEELAIKEEAERKKQEEELKAASSTTKKKVVI